MVGKKHQDTLEVRFHKYGIANVKRIPEGDGDVSGVTGKGN
jgi:hypothetical protein